MSRRGPGTDGLSVIRSSSSKDGQTLAAYALWCTKRSQWTGSRAYVHFRARLGRGCWSRCSAGYHLLAKLPVPKGRPEPVGEGCDGLTGDNACRFIVTEIWLPVRSLSPWLIRWRPWAGRGGDAGFGVGRCSGTGVTGGTPVTARQKTVVQELVWSRLERSTLGASAAKPGCTSSPARISRHRGLSGCCCSELEECWSNGGHLNSRPDRSFPAVVTSASITTSGSMTARTGWTSRRRGARPHGEARAPTGTTPGVPPPPASSQQCAACHPSGGRRGRPQWPTGGDCENRCPITGAR